MISKNRALAINSITSMVAFISNLAINFFLSPYIVRKLGVEANGFIMLANNFVNYAGLASIALNSMSGRFITLNIYREDMEEAGRYYSTITVANSVFALLMLIPAILVSFYLEHIIKIPSNLVWDVKMLFFLTFSSFLLGVASSSWGVATFVTNRLYLSSIIRMNSQVLKAIVILGLFGLFKPSVHYAGIAKLVMAIYVAIISFRYKKLLLPEIHVRKKDVIIGSLKEIIRSSVWNTVQRTGMILLSGLDLLIANLFLGATQMGMLALAKTVPNVIVSMAGTISSVFAPTLTMYYARSELENMKKELKKSMKLLGVLLVIPLSILIVFGMDFFRLWVPSQDARVLHILSILTIFSLVFTSGVQSLYNIFTITDRLKVPAILIVISGILSTGTVFLLLHTTNLGIYAVAGVSSFINLARNMLFTVPFGAKYLKLRWNTFFPEVFFSVISVASLVTVGLFTRSAVAVDSWLGLVLAALITSVAGLVINMYIVLSAGERRYLAELILKRIKRKS